MENLEYAASAIDSAIEAVKALGESKKTGAMVRKLTIVKAEIAGELAKESAMASLPKKTKKSEA
jgi:hypothetical protein